MAFNRRLFPQIALVVALLVSLLAGAGIGLSGKVRAAESKLTGIAFGTSPAWNNGTSTYDKAFDGNTGTFFDYAQADGGYTGIDLGDGNAKKVTKVRFVPRAGYESRMVGGKLQGSTSGTNSGFVDLHTITTAPAAGWTEVTITNPNAYRYLRYLSPAGGYANIAELEFYGDAVTTTPGGTGTGLKGEYFDNMDLTNLKVTRTDGPIQFQWAGGSPDSSIAADTFSVRWTGQVEPTSTGTYTFYTKTDDGVKLWVNGTLIIDKWIDQAPVEWSGTIALTAGQKADIKLEYFENAGGAEASLSWSGPNVAKEIIPQSRLYPASGSTVSDKAVTKVRFYPRAGWAGRMLNGKFTGSNTSQTNDFVTLATITSTPAENAWTEITLNNSTVYRYIKFESPQGGWGNVAEVEFYNGNTKLTGVGFGSAGSFGNGGNDYTKALDGNTTTFFDAAFADGAYVGIDIGDANQVAAPVFTPQPGSYAAAQSVAISSATSGASIRYTTNGSTPSSTSGTLYTGPITVSATTTIVAIAYKSGMADSPTRLGTFTIGGTGPKQGQRTYHLGNSLTDTINDWLAPVAQSAGYQHQYYRTTIPGAPTDWIWDHPGNANGEPDYRVVFDTKAPLDHLFTQPFAGHARSIENEAEYSGKFYQLAMQKSPNVQHWLYIQWPDKQFGDAWSQATGSASGLGLTPATTWEKAVANHVAYHEAVRQRMDDQNGGKPILIVPAGQALVKLKQEIEAGRVSGITDFFNTHFSDDLHLSSKGMYLVSLVFYSCIYQESPEGKVTYANTGLTAAQAAIYQKIAWDTARTYSWSGIPQ